MNTWQNLFSGKILNRGLDYYRIGQVISLEERDGRYEAVVSGSEEYNVEIVTENGEIKQMHCDCPYAADGNNCKHMAAVLYQIENGSPIYEEFDDFEDISSDLSDCRTDKTEVLTKIVDNIPEQELRELVKSYALNDNRLRNSILSRYAPASPELLSGLKREADEIAEAYLDDYGYAGYENAFDYSFALDCFLDKNVQLLIDQGCRMEAFELTNYVFCELSTTEMDDSDGGLTMVGDTCYDLWKQILDKATESEEKEMYLWFQKHKNYYLGYDMEQYIKDFLFNEFHSESFLRENLKELDRRIQKIEKSLGFKNHSDDYDYIQYLLRRISIMNELNLPKEEITSYRSRYWDFPAIREAEVQECLEAKDYEKAIEILLESKEIDKDKEHLLDDYGDQLIKIYNKIGLKKECKEELINYINRFMQYDIENILLLKSLCEENEWKERRTAFLNSNKSWQVRCALMEEEGMYKELLSEIAHNRDLYVLNQYEKSLKKYFPKETMNLYADYLQELAESASERKAYHNLMHYLKKIAGYKDGRPLARQIAEDWRVQYKRRPAMMDELIKAGF